MRYLFNLIRFGAVPLGAFVSAAACASTADDRSSGGTTMTDGGDAPASTGGAAASGGAAAGTGGVNVGGAGAGGVTAGGAGTGGQVTAGEGGGGAGGEDAGGGDGGSDASHGCREGESRACYSGPPATQGLGVCRDGVQTCQNGLWGACLGSVLPELEVCDTLDNDCNGSVDEGCACVDGKTRPCYTGPTGTANTGRCKDGLQTCNGGFWGLTCDGEVKPAPETCNDVDDDCNGFTDDGNPGGGATCDTGEPGACGAGTETCMGGALLCVQTVQPKAETCNGIDDNCDGQTDEGNPDGGGACVTGQPGVCSPGTEQCQNGSIACQQSVQASSETCDGKDNNCNGQTDEGNPGGGGSCSTGQPGPCDNGQLQCLGGSLQCQQTNFGSAEICNGIDDDCDGTPDDNPIDVGGSCITGVPGPCSAGQFTCQGGARECQQLVFPKAESCNSIDDDCNGVPDDGDPGGGGSCTTAYCGVCRNGTRHCTGGSLQCTANKLPGGTELCWNGQDDDCDCQVDEFCCPYVFSHDGRGYAYETTVGGGALVSKPHQLDARHRGKRFRFMPMWVRLDEAAIERDARGRGRVRAKVLAAEEEIVYLDEAHLTVVEHPEGYEVVTSTSMNHRNLDTEDPREIHALRTAALRSPERALWLGEIDVTADLSARTDRPAPHDLARENFYELDFGSVNDASCTRLVIDGWTLRKRRRLARGARGRSPSLEAQQADGTWRRVKDLGVPRGDRKAMVVDLSGVEWPTGRYRLRLHTGTLGRGTVVWHLDRVRLTEEPAAPVRVVNLRASEAELRFSGAPTPLHGPDEPRFCLDDGRGALGRDQLTYGRFTRYGDVRELLREPDDRLVVLRQGDGVELRFDGVPEARDGRELTLLLHTELVYKPRRLPGHAPTARTVFAGPLPYHGMHRYGAEARGRFPDDEKHRRYLAEHQTREHLPGDERWGPLEPEALAA